MSGRLAIEERPLQQSQRGPALEMRTNQRARHIGRLVDRLQALLFVAPIIALLAAFVVLPLGKVFYYSLTDWNGLTSPKWIGIGNYRFLWGSADFHKIVLTNVYLVVGIVAWVAVPFTLAVLLHERPRANLARTVLFIPVLLPPAIVGGMFRLLLSVDGPINSALRGVGLGGIAAQWLVDRRLVLVSVILMITWALAGSGILFYSAGLAAIPRSYVEAAQIDGASWRQLVWWIYRPALRPVTRFWVLLLTIATVTSFFPWIFGLTRGGPGIDSTTIDYSVYQTGIVTGQWGMAAAIAVTGIVFAAVLLGAQLLGRRIRRTDA